MRADFSKRVDLLRAFAELDEHWKPGLHQAIDLLQTERARRLQQSATDIGALLVDVLTMHKTAPLAEGEDQATQQEKLVGELKQSIARVERNSRDRVEDIYRHFHLHRQDTTSRVVDSDLFAGESWEVFGLSRQQLVVTGALSGAVAGSGLDLLLGGASLMLGASVGAAIGSMGAWLGATELAKVKILGQSLGGRVLQVGPVQEANFPWVVLGRAWLDFRLVSERNHAKREAIALDAEQAEHHMDTIDGSTRRDLQTIFTKLRKEPDSAASPEQLTELVATVLQHEPPH